LIKDIKGARFLDKEHWYPQPRNLIALAIESIENKKSETAFKIKPLYLYPKECQIKAQNSKLKA
jgi:hypothetical protein